MASRGEVLRSRRRLGFAPRGMDERFVVVQEERLGPVLDTVIVIPLDVASAMYEGHPGVVPVSAAEAGAGVPHVALATHPCTLALDRFDPGAAGRLLPATMASLDRLLKLVMGLA